MSIINFDTAVEQIKKFLPQYLEEHGIDIQKNFNCIFPDHRDSTPSANLVGKDSPRVFCHGCLRYADLFDVVHLFENKPKLGVEWLQDTFHYLAKKYHIDVQLESLTSEQLYELDIYKAYCAAAQLLTTTNLEHNIVFQRELKKRGWNPSFLRRESVGTVSSYAEFHRSLLTQGFSAIFLQEIDLSRKDIFNSNNMIFTWKDERGRPVGFVSRNLKYEEDKAQADQTKQVYKGSKYINQRTTGLKHNIFQKGKRFYGIDVALKYAPPLYIFEGQADVITARAHGLHNCVAISGSALKDAHIALLKHLGVYDVILCLDGDETGRTKLKEILEKKFAGNRDMKVRLVELPDGEDPDSFIRTSGIKSFKELACWSAFEWRLNQYAEDADESEICQHMIPFIVNESSPIIRDKLCKILAQRTGVTLKAINAELNILLDAKAHRRSKERQDVIDQAIYELRNNPEGAEGILYNVQNSLMDLVKKHDVDNLSNEDFVRALAEQKNNEEAAPVGHVGFKLGKDLRELEEILRGDWHEGMFICIGGKPNSGKSAWLVKLAFALATHNNDVCVIFHSIDDTAEQIVPRFVAVADGSKKLSINMVRQPNYWSKIAGLDYVIPKREQGYIQIRQLAQDGRLIVKDLNHGGSIPFIENLICYFQDKYPERKIVYILDNFHKLRDFDKKDERVRFKKLSETIKSISIRRSCCMISSIEYTKLPNGVKPTNNNISETVQIEFDATAIIHLYSDVADNPESFTVCHRDIDWQSNEVFLPRVEFIVGKNKITEQKRSFFLDFWPASSDYRYVDQATVIKEAQEIKQNKRGGNQDELTTLYGAKNASI